MEFKELVNELMHQGWRVYSSEGIDSYNRSSFFKNPTLEIRVYEGKPFIFVKTKIKKNDKSV